MRHHHACENQTQSRARPPYSVSIKQSRIPDHFGQSFRLFLGMTDTRVYCNEARTLADDKLGGDAIVFHTNQRADMV